MRGGCGLEILRAGRVRVRDSSCGSGAGWCGWASAV